MTHFTVSAMNQGTNRTGGKYEHVHVIVPDSIVKIGVVYLHCKVLNILVLFFRVDYDM